MKRLEMEQHQLLSLVRLDTGINNWYIDKTEVGGAID